MILAFEQALLELVDEGGVEGRAARYSANNEVLLSGMRDMGFTEYLSPDLQGVIITAFCYPDHPHFRFDEFYTALNDKGFVIYPGKVSDIDCFRIGNIGHLFESDISALLAAIEATLNDLDIVLTRS